ncbi:MAG: hypothetical protein H7122_07010 [Chitinophagaceae bacterium]|nr:hypothetical protein [Chitinophagaceae bacterium]
MKSLFVLFSAAVLTISSCADEGNPSKDGEEQVPQPVENSGANTEGERAVEATVNDSTKSDKSDSANRPEKKDSTKNR